VSDRVVKAEGNESTLGDKLLRSCGILNVLKVLLLCNISKKL
jgi:hypothetical protein